MKDIIVDEEKFRKLTEDPRKFLEHHLECAKLGMTFEEMATSLGVDKFEYINAVQEIVMDLVCLKEEVTA